MTARVIAVIPARGGSKGLPRKNVRPLDGRPLIAYPVRAALASGICDRVIVTTDDEEIAAHAREAGAEVPFERPAEVSGDLATTEETLRHALLTYEAQTGLMFDTCVFLTATSIFRKVEWIRDVVRRLHADPDLESVFVVSATQKNYWHRGADGSFERILPWMRVYSNRQVRQSVYREDTGLACASRAWLWREGRRIGDRVDFVVNTDTAADIDIHTEEDLLLAEQLLQFRKRKGLALP